MKKFLLLTILYPITLTLSAQLCSGSLGDPVAAFRFGTGRDNGPPLPPNITNYSYSGSSCPNDGFYTITSSATQCFGGTWHNLGADHTPNDTDGKFMLVNASLAPGIFYLDTVRGLCGGTTYEFSAFIVNLLRPNSCNGRGTDPNLTFTIERTDGTIITEYSTGDIAETDLPTWVQYGTFFQTPANISTVVLRIRNNAPGGCGNDLAIDDILFRPCGPRVDAGVSQSTSDSISLCADDTRSFLLEATYSAGYADPRLQWQLSTDQGLNWQNIAGATTTTYTRNPTGAGNFQYRLLVADGANINNPVCRVASLPVTFIVNPLPLVQLPDNITACSGNTVVLETNTAGSHVWTGPGGFSSTQQRLVFPDIRTDQAGLYAVTVTTDAGCVASDNVTLAVNTSAVATVSADQGICEGASVQLVAGGGNTFAWSPSTGLNDPTSATPLASPRDSITYQVIVSNDARCPDTATVRVAVWRNPTANAGPDLWTLNGIPVMLQGSSAGTGISIAWQPPTGLSDPASTTPTATLTANGFIQTFTYRLNVQSNLGCGTATDEMILTVFESFTIPNTFTPNGDGFNDTWEIRLLQAFPNAIVEVYNTAGSLVHRTVGYTTPWDGRRNGKELPSGTYYYTIDLKSPGLKKQVGYVTILR
jgi:gliding motility-associated-like protein